MSGAAISERAARWCSQKRDHLTFFSPKASGGMERTGREVGKQGGEEPRAPRPPSCTRTNSCFFLLLFLNVLVLVKTRLPAPCLISLVGTTRSGEKKQPDIPPRLIFLPLSHV